MELCALLTPCILSHLLGTLLANSGPLSVHIPLTYGAKNPLTPLQPHPLASGIKEPFQTTYSSLPRQIKAGQKEFGPFCGEKSPGHIETQTNSVQIRFHSDNSGENRGWKLSYTAIGNSCCFPLFAGLGNGKGFIEPAGGHHEFGGP